MNTVVHGLIHTDEHGLAKSGWGFVTFGDLPLKFDLIVTRINMIEHVVDTDKHVVRSWNKDERGSNTWLRHGLTRISTLEQV